MMQQKKGKNSEKQGKRKSKKERLLTRYRELLPSLLIGAGSVAAPGIIALGLKWLSKLKEPKVVQTSVEVDKPPSLMEQYRAVRKRMFSYMDGLARDFIKSKAERYPTIKRYDLDLPEYQPLRAFDETGDIKHLQSFVNYILDEKVLPSAKSHFKIIFDERKLPKSLYNTFKKENFDALVEYTKKLMSNYIKPKT